MPREILLIEDQHSEAFDAFLADMGFAVIRCTNLEETRTAIAGLQSPPAGVWLDFQMPFGPGLPLDFETGRDCLRILEENSLTKNVPIIACTAFRKNLPQIQLWCEVYKMLRQVLDKGQATHAEMKKAVLEVFGPP